MSAKSSPQVKICGITNYPDAVMAIDAGADLLGFNFYPGSKRYISPVDAQVIVRRLPPIVEIVGIFVDAEIESVKQIARLVPLDLLQFHGDENTSYLEQFTDWKIIKAFRLKSVTELDNLPPYSCLADFFLFDTFSDNAQGGTGEMMQNSIVDALSQRGFLTSGFLSGGLTPENISKEVATFTPYGVDVASGVEKSPGIKDTTKVREFIKNARI